MRMGNHRYLSRLLLVREEHLLRIRGFALRRLLPDPSQAEYSDLLEELTDLHQLYSTIEYTSSLRTLAFAFSCVYTLMEQLDLLKGAAKPFGSRASRHELRFKPFLSVSLPELPSLQEFEGRLEFGMNGAAKTLEIARGAMGRAKAGLESQLKLHDKRKQTESSGGLPNGKILEMKNQEVEGVMRSCIAMGLVLDRLRRGMESRTVDELRLEMGGVLPWEAGTGLYHRWWIVPTLGPSKAKQPTPAAGAQAKGEEQAVMESNAK